MNKFVVLFALLLLRLSICFGQTIPRTPPARTPVPQAQDPAAEIDSLRKAEEESQDSLVFTAKYIRYTRLRLLNDSTITLPIDTSLRNLQTYNPQYDPYSPTLNLGNFGLSSRDLLFSQRKNIGFDAGFHALDRFVFNQDSVSYYRARTPFTQLWYVNGSQKEQFFQLTHTQNIKPNWNAGAVYRRIGADGYYQSQRGDHTNIMTFTWYESPGKRYNLLVNGLFNTLKAGENGSPVSDDVFEADTGKFNNSEFKSTKLQGTRTNRPAQSWKNREFFVKQYYYIGRIDSLEGDSTQAILPTQRISYTLHYIRDQYKFFRNESDSAYHAFPHILPGSTVLTNDSTRVTRLENEFAYSFYLRGRSVSFLKNEVKLDVGLRHELVRYRQFNEQLSFQNVIVFGNTGYRFSDRAFLRADLEQVVTGRNIGDFRFEANTSFLLSRSVGRIVLGAYVVNRSPEHIFERVDYQFHKWDLDLKNTRTSNLSFQYQNAPFKLSAKAEYFLISNYLYLAETSVPQQVIPTQSGSNINLLKITIAKNFTYRKFTLENFLVYQKTEELLRTPEVYLYNSLYRSQRFFKAIDTQIGADSRYNTSFAMPFYAVNISQFYNGQALDYPTYPVIDIWLKASLRRATIFVKQNYLNQGLFSKGYYTVNHYPMPNKLFLFGVKWNFYN